MTTAVRPAFARQQRVGRELPFWGRLLVAVIALGWSTTLVVDFRIALTLLWVLGLGVAAIGLRYPRLALLGIGTLCTLDGLAAPLLLHGGLWRWNTVNYLLLFVALLFWPHLLRVGRVQSRILLAFILLLCLEILLSPDPLDGVQHVFSVVPAFGLLIYVRRVALDPDAWYWLGKVSGVLAAGGSLAFLLQQGSLPYVNPNAWSYLPLTGMLVSCLAFVATQDARRRWLGLGVMALINGVWVFLSGSRGNLLIAAACIAFLLTMTHLRRAISFAVVAAVAALVILSQFTTLRERSVARLRLFIDPSESLSVRTSGRFDLMLGAWYMFRDHPFGVGTGGFSSTWVRLDPRVGMTPFRRSVPTAAHSAWMKVLAENGFPGILMLGAYVLSFTLSGWRTRDPTLLRLGVMVTAVLAIAWVSTEFWNPGIWLFAAAATVLLDRKSVGSAFRHEKSIVDG